MATTDIGRVTPIWRGFYSAAATYELNDIVIDTAGSVWWHKSPEVTTGVTPAAGAIWDAVIDMSVFSGLIQAAITTAQTALEAAREAVGEVSADTERAETAANNAEISALNAAESAAGVGALAQAAERSAEAAAGSATGAAGSAQAAAGSKSDAEAYAVGTRGGEDVGSTDPTYHNNAKYYAEQAASEAEAAAQSAEDAQDVLDSIPEDYSQLSADVGELKTQISDIDEALNGETITNYVADKNINNANGETYGELVDDEGKCTSEYIPYTWTGKTQYWANEAGTAYRIAFYDANKDCLMVFSGNASNERRAINAETSVTGTVAFVRFAFKKGTVGKAIDDADTSITYWSAETITVSEGIAAEVAEHDESITALQEDVGELQDDVGELQGTAELQKIEDKLYPEWFSGGYRTSTSGTVYQDSRYIRTDYIKVGNKIDIAARENYYVRVWRHSLDGAFIDYIDWTLGGVTVLPTECAFIRLEVRNSATSAITEDPNTVGRNISIVRSGICHVFKTEFDAVPNDPNVDMNQVLPKYLVLCACREKFADEKMIETVGYLYRTCVEPYKFYYASGRSDIVRYLFDWDSELAASNTASNRSTPNYYSYAVTDEGDVVCVYRGEIVSTYPRANPIVYSHTDYTSPVIVDLSSKEAKPTAWISNCGMYTQPGEMWFGEYIRSWHTYAYVWKVVSPYINAANWTIEKTYERDTEPISPSTMVLGRIEHIHHVAKDPYTGIIYVTTGDHYLEARIDYYKDGAWGILREGDESVCRQLNFIFTKDYVYWASDASVMYDPETEEYVKGAHKFFRAVRDSNGLIDLSNDGLDVYQLPDLYPSMATYHTCYVKEPECILILDRHDGQSAYCEFPIRIWDIKRERLEIAGVIHQVPNENEISGGLYCGFRTECTQHYPNAINNYVSVGFSLYPNEMDICGNPPPLSTGLTSDDSKNFEQVNSFTMAIRES